MSGSRLPRLGPRGEGWFALQLLLFAAVAAAGSVHVPLPRPITIATDASGVVLIALGGLLAFRGVLDLRENLTVFPRPVEHVRLVDTGAYRLVRHPIYGGLIVAAVGWALVTASPPASAAAVLLAGFFELKSRREEAWLAERLAGYEAYRRRTRRLVPWLH